jgi:hypothetical protein
MSEVVGTLATRLWVASHLVFQDSGPQKSDVLSIAHGAQTELIAFLEHMIKCGHHIEVTAIRSDHSCDGMGVGYHYQGWAIDCWPLNSTRPGDYMSVDTHEFRQFLVDAIAGPFYFQTGLGGSANTVVNQFAAGAAWFPDNDEDHIHFGVRPTLDSEMLGA